VCRSAPGGLIAVVTFLVVAGCSSSQADRVLPIPDDAREEVIDGVAVHLDDEKGVLYTEDCDVARRLTREGAKYGPVGDNDSTSDHPSYAFVCTSEPQN
jgi:hypothetical protein